jgi:hypothetical protein
MGVNETPSYFRHVSALRVYRHLIYINTTFPGELIKFTLGHSIFIILKISENFIYAAAYNSVVSCWSKFTKMVSPIWLKYLKCLHLGLYLIKAFTELFLLLCCGKRLLTAGSCIKL